MGEYVKSNFGSRYKTQQLYDLSKRVYNCMTKDFNIFTEWNEFFGEFSDFSHQELTALACLQNLHSLSKVVNSLSGSYPQSLLGALWMEGCRFVAPRCVFGSKPI